eukprot:501191-Rhodomonas_salina.1
MPSKEIKKWVSSTTNHHSLVSLFTQSERELYFAKSNVSPSMSDISPELNRSLGGAMCLSLPKDSECSCQCQARSTLCVHELYMDGGAPFGATDTQDSQKRTGKTKESSPMGESHPMGESYPTGESYQTGESYPTGESSPMGESSQTGESDYGQTPTLLWGWIGSDPSTHRHAAAAARELSCEGEHPLTEGEDTDNRVIHI